MTIGTGETMKTDQDDAPRGVLSGAEIRRLVTSDRPLVRHLRDLEEQIQPNGIDLTIDSIWQLAGHGCLGQRDELRVLPAYTEVRPAGEGVYALSPSSYIVRLREIVDLPTDLMAFGRPRSSVLRCGVSIHTGVWDAGYMGRSETLMVVQNQAGFRVQRGTRILQLVFCRLNEQTVAYDGVYQREKLPPSDGGELG